MKAIVVREGERPVVEEIGEGLRAMQTVVGGLIQMIRPWGNDVALVCNEEGKINGMPVNRILTDDKGRILDVIFGDFFLCWAPPESEELLGMPDELIDQYMRKL